MSDNALAYMFRIFWIVFLAFILVDTFCKSWNTENGKNERVLPNGHGTFVGYDPILFPIIAAIYLALCIGIPAAKKEDILLNAITLMDMVLFITIYFTILLIFLPVLRRYYMAKTCAAFWIVPVVLYFQPNMLETFAVPPAVVFYIPENFLTILGCIWITGFGVIFTIQVMSHLRFSKKLQTNSRPVEDDSLLELWNKMKKEMDIPLIVDLKYCSEINTPLTLGMRMKNTTTYLPEHSFTDEEAELIFAHELRHIQRRDTHMKFFLRFCCAFGWIHPLIWVAVRKAEDDLELSCDEIVLKDADKDKRRKYAELLLSIAGDSRGYSTCLSASARSLRYRLKAALPVKNKRKGVVLLFLIMIASGLCTGRLALSTNRGTLSELAGPDTAEMSNADVKSGRYDDFHEIKDVGELSQYLSEMEVERILTGYENETSEGGLRGEFAASNRSFALSGNFLSITNIVSGETEKYYIRISLDWEFIESLK